MAVELVDLASPYDDNGTLKKGGDGDPGEDVLMLLSEAIEREEKKGRRLVWSREKLGRSSKRSSK